MAAPRGIGEVPTQLDNGPQHRRLLVDMREQILQLRQRTAVPPAPTNLKVTAQSFQNTVQWSRSQDADYYEVFHSTTPDVSRAQIHDVGNSVQWQDAVGQAGIKKWYWVRSRKNTGAASAKVGPVNAMTLASGTGVTPPTPPPAGTILVLNQATGQYVSYVLAGERLYIP